MRQILLFLLIGSIACHFKDKARKIYVGTALDPNALNEAQYKKMAAEEFNCMTCENQMKMDATEPQNGKFNYGSADGMVSFAKQNGMKVRGHTLVWHAQVPGWVNGLQKAQVEEAMKTHITNEVTHYKGIYAWDVCNEIFNEDGTLRASVWHNNLGDGFVATAFKTAAAADPGAKLYINDYNIEGINRKSTGLYNLVKKLKSEGVPIHGVGIQGHMGAGSIPGDLAANMKRFSDLGLDVAITELDIGLNGKSQQVQADSYATVFKDCLSVPRCVGITMWGFTDKHSWISDKQALPWDKNYNPKPAVAAIENVLQ